MTSNKKTVTKILVSIIAINAFVFLLLAYLKKLSTEPKDLVFIDFWGRLTVYSLWFMAYELYRNYINKDETEKI